ncbi:MAG: hypothetical protein P8H37_11395, partial [Paracoccaceae bacterium]|nr:hypothetical protein [Paracoccaceae bacterium]
CRGGNSGESYKKPFILREDAPVITALGHRHKVQPAAGLQLGRSVRGPRPSEVHPWTLAF